MPHIPRATFLAIFTGLTAAMTSCSGGGTALTAPTISGLHLEPRLAYVSSTPVHFSVGFDLVDPNADVATASFTLRDASGNLVDQQSIHIASPLTNARIQGSAVVPLPQTGVFTVELWTTDAASLVSNALTETVEVVPYPWSDVPVDPVLRDEAAAVALDGQVFVIGGSRQDLGVIPGPCSPLVACLDPATGVWTMAAELAVPRKALAAAVAGGRIYAIGGESTPTALGSLVGTVEQYDPLLASWTTKTPMPTTRYHIAAATVGDRIYVVGGRAGGSEPLATVESYDPVADTWTTHAPLPHPRYDARAAAFGGRLVVVGGQRDANHCEDRVDVFDPATGTWSNEFLWYGCCTYLVVADNQLLAGNGTTLSRATGTDLAGWYGLTPSRWTSFASSTAAATNDSVFVFGWMTAERYTPALEIR